jgi:hypothetical protein
MASKRKKLLLKQQAAYWRKYRKLRHQDAALLLKMLDIQSKIGASDALDKTKS